MQQNINSSTESPKENALAIQSPANISKQQILPSLIPDEHELNVIKTIASQAHESKFYNNLGGIPGIMAIMLYARELGVPPMTAISQGFYNVHGRFEMSARLMNMRVIQAGHSIEIIEVTNEKCVLAGKRSDNGKEWTQIYTIEDAKRAQLIKPGSAWEKTPDDMLFARCLSKLCRRLFPDIIGSCYVEGEVQDLFEDSEKKTSSKNKKQAIFVSPNKDENKKNIIIDIDTSVTQDQKDNDTKQQTETQTEIEPDEQIVNLFERVKDYLNKNYSLHEKPGGWDYAIQLICEKFGVDNPIHIPGSMIEEFRRYCRKELLDELARESWIPTSNKK